MAAIASLSLNLETKTTAWSAGLKKARADAETFYASVGKTASAGLGILANVAKGAAVGIAGIAVAATAAGAAIASAGLDRIDLLSDTAQRLGVTTDALAELRHAANLTGSSAEDLDTALEKLNTNLGDSAQKATPTSEALARLGLDARELANAGADVAFRKIVKGFEQIDNSAEKASLAMDIFGKGGIKILNTLSAGSGTISDLSEEALKFGLAISGVDAAKVGIAKDELDRAAGAVEGLSNSFAVALTPAIVAATTEFLALAAAVETGGGKIDGVLEAVIVKVADMATALQNVGFLWQMAQNAATSAAGTITTEIANFNARLLDTVPGLQGLAGELRATFGVLGQELVKEAARANKALEKELAGPDAGDKILAKFRKAKADLAKVAANPVGPKAAGDGAMQKLGKSIEEVTAKLKDQADTFGKTAAEADIYRLAAAGASEAQLAGARKQAARLLELEAQKKDDEDVIANATGPFDKEPEKQFAGAAQLGSSEAYSAIIAATSGRSGDGMKDVARSSTKTADNTSKLVGIFQTVAKFLGQPDPALAIP